MPNRIAPGALAWLRKTLQLADHPDTAYLGPEELELALAALPQKADEVWEIEARQLDEEMVVDGEFCRPWVFAAVDADNPSNLLQIGCSPVEYSVEEILDLAGESMLNPVTGEARRPGKLLLSSSPLAKDLYKKLKKLKVRCEYRPELEGVDLLFSQRLDFVRQFVRGFQDAPVDLDLDDLRDLPQFADEVWQIDSRHLPVLLGVGDDAASPTLLLIVDAQDNLVPAMELQSDPTRPFQPEQTLLKAISFPMVGEPRRPAVVQVRTKQIADALRETLDALDIGLEVTKNLDQWDEAFAMLSQKIGGDGQQRPALVELPGATTEQVAAIFDAAAGFYRAAPWRLVLGDTIIRVECPELASAPWFACVMGQMGETLGVALYEDERYIQNLLRERDLDPKKSMRGCSSLVIMYGEKHEAAPQDVAGVQKHRLPLAAPEAYPTLMRVKPGIAIQSPLLWEAKFMEATLRAIPSYLKQRDRQRHTIPVTAFGKSAEVTLELIS
ncbi:MAG: hypothetical protein K8R36_04330 [Planctomycetales bacterium]|nr:hypothetical protein [Planctomycetales bacterium]